MPADAKREPPVPPPARPRPPPGEPPPPPATKASESRRLVRVCARGIHGATVRNAQKRSQQRSLATTGGGTGAWIAGSQPSCALNVVTRMAVTQGNLSQMDQSGGGGLLNNLVARTAVTRTWLRRASCPSVQRRRDVASCAGACARARCHPAGCGQTVALVMRRARHLPATAPQ
jgi:hypothetical protein